MASKDTNRTILTVALVGVGGYAAFKLLPVLLSKLAGAGNSGYSGSGSGSADDYGDGYTEMDTTGGQQSLLGSILSALMGSGSGSGGRSGLNGGNPQAGAGGSGSSYSADPGSADLDGTGVYAGSDGLASFFTDINQLTANTPQPETSADILGYESIASIPLQTLDVSAIPQASGVVGSGSSAAVASGTSLVNADSGSGGDPFSSDGGSDSGDPFSGGSVNPDGDFADSGGSTGDDGGDDFGDYGE